METKNFLFLVICLSSITSCTTVPHNQRRVSPPYSVEPGQPTPVLPQQALTPNIPQNVVGMNPPTPGQVLPVGIWLGPGAIRSYAHIGVLRVLQRAQIPIVAIGGSEWGSIVGASFALSKGANEVEWEMLKLKKEELPSVGLLSRQMSAQDPQELFNFLSSAFGEKDLGQSNIPFRCSTTDGQDTTFISSGKAREQLLRCAVLPPLYKFYDRAGKAWVSGAISPGNWPDELRKAGAQYIIYVDVINRGSLLTSKNYSNENQLKALWIALRSISQQQHLFANLTIEVPSDIDLVDFDRRREAIGLGEKAASDVVDGITKAIGLTR